jgi:hypothetical protein
MLCRPVSEQFVALSSSPPAIGSSAALHVTHPSAARDERE